MIAFNHIVQVLHLPVLNCRRQLLLIDQRRARCSIGWRVVGANHSEATGTLTVTAVVTSTAQCSSQ